MTPDPLPKLASLQHVACSSPHRLIFLGRTDDSIRDAAWFAEDRELLPVSFCNFLYRTLLCVLSFCTCYRYAAAGGFITGAFFTSVVIEKIGHTIAFVLIFYLGRHSLSQHWVLYAFGWWTMFALGELALAIRQPTYTTDMAVGGVIAEAIYLPLAALSVQRILGVGHTKS